MLVVEVVALPAFIALFNLSVDLPLLILALVLGTLGLAGVGTLFAAIAAHTRAREVLLPLLLFPDPGAGDPGHGQVDRRGDPRARASSRPTSASGSACWSPSTRCSWA